MYLISSALLPSESAHLLLARYPLLEMLLPNPPWQHLFRDRRAGLQSYVQYLPLGMGQRHSSPFRSHVLESLCRCHILVPHLVKIKNHTSSYLVKTVLESPFYNLYKNMIFTRSKKVLNWGKSRTIQWCKFLYCKALLDCRIYSTKIWYNFYSHCEPQVLSSIFGTRWLKTIVALRTFPVKSHQEGFSN
jgi:hypothetical protein